MASLAKSLPHRPHVIGPAVNTESATRIRRPHSHAADTPLLLLVRLLPDARSAWRQATSAASRRRSSARYAAAVASGTVVADHPREASLATSMPSSPASVRNLTLCHRP